MSDRDLRAALGARLARETACLDRAPRWFYPAWSAAIVASQCLGWAMMNIGHLGVAALGVVVAGVGQVHAGSFGHDASHGARGMRDRRRIGWVMFNLVLGYPATLWHAEHDALHHPNLQMLGVDPNLEAGRTIVALCPENADGRGGFGGLAKRYQHLWFLPALTVSQGARLLVEALVHCARQRRVSDIIGIALHLAIWYGVPAMLAGPWRATVGFVALLAVRGAYFFLIVVNHHVGAPTVPTSARPSPFRAQIECSVDLRTPPVLVAFLGRHALHHVFPNVPSQRLAEGSGTLAGFCAEHGIGYTEKGWLTALRDVQQHVRQMAMLERERYRERAQRTGDRR